MQCNFFSRYYQCRLLCEQCLSEKPTARAEPLMNYQNFKPNSPRYLTYISDGTYRRTAEKLSPWVCMPGWSLRSCFYDIMHTIYLGIGRDLISNLLADFDDCGLLGCGGLQQLDSRLRKFSLSMYKRFHEERFLGWYWLSVVHSPLKPPISRDINFSILDKRVSKDQLPKDSLHRVKHGVERQQTSWAG